MHNSNTTTGLANLNGTILGNVWIASPPLEEQRGIARFLDEQTEKIDGLIGAKRDLLALLKEKRQAVITNAVTKGLDPAAKLQPSGVEWLGDVPEHWDVLPLRRKATRIQTGSTPPTQEDKYYEQGDVPWYGPSSFSDRIEVGSAVKHISLEALEDGVARMFAADSVLVITIGATLGKVAWLPREGSTNQQITSIALDRRTVAGKFVAYQLKLIEKRLRHTAPSATLPILDIQGVASIPVAFPPRKEQEEIVTYLNAEIEKLQEISAETLKAISSLESLRASIISAAVTGKIDVRGATVQARL